MEKRLRVVFNANSISAIELKNLIRGKAVRIKNIEVETSVLLGVTASISLTAAFTFFVSSSIHASSSNMSDPRNVAWTSLVAGRQTAIGANTPYILSKGQQVTVKDNTVLVEKSYCRLLYSLNEATTTGTIIIHIVYEDVDVSDAKLAQLYIDADRVS